LAGASMERISPLSAGIHASTELGALVAFWVRRFRRFGRFGRFRRYGRLGGLRLGLEIILLPTFGKSFRLSNVNDTQKIVKIFLFSFRNFT